MEVKVEMSGEEKWAEMERCPLGLSARLVRGVLHLSDVKRRSPAEAAGLKVGDRVTAYHGCPDPTSAKDFKTYLHQCWMNRCPAVLQTDKKNSKGGGGRPKVTPKQSEEERRASKAASWKHGYYLDPEARREKSRLRMEKYRESMSEEQKAHFRQTCQEYYDEHKGLKEPVDVWEKVREKIQQLEKNRAMRERAFLPDYGASLEPLHCQDEQPLEKARAAFLMKIGAQREAFRHRDLLSEEHRLRVEKDWAEAERRQGLAYYFDRFLGEKRLAHNLIVRTSLQTGPFTSAVLRVIGFNPHMSGGGDHRSIYQQKYTAVKKLAFRQDGKERVSGALVTLVGDSEAEELEAEFFLVTVGRDGVAKTTLPPWEGAEEKLSDAMERRRAMAEDWSSWAEPGDDPPFHHDDFDTSDDDDPYSSR